MMLFTIYSSLCLFSIAVNQLPIRNTSSIKLPILSLRSVLDKYPSGIPIEISGMYLVIKVTQLTLNLVFSDIYYFGPLIILILINFWFQFTRRVVSVLSQELSPNNCYLVVTSNEFKKH